jgi:dTDP-4-dehydrorhamnose reductase
MKHKIYVAGAAGMLGDAINEIFKNEYDLRCTDINNEEHWISFLDFRDNKKYENDVRKFAPDFLFHIGAFTDLEYCEKNSDEAYITNSLSVENAINIANKFKIPIIYISTAGIFDGNKDLYDDWDEPNPIGIYARSKYIGEKLVETRTNEFIIVRAGWMMGGGEKKDKKFIQKIMSQIKKGNKKLNIVNDKMGTPTYTIDFAKNLKLILENKLWGKYNLVCGGLTDRLEVAKELLKILKLENKIEINIVSSEFWKKEYSAPRPKCERLINKKLNLRDLNIMRDWKVCLKEYISTHYKNYLNVRK